MKEVLKRSYLAIAAVVTLGLALAGCGSGGGLSSQVVSGTAAVGAPLAGQVSLKDSSATPQMKTVVIDNNGRFAIDVTGMQPPYILQATGSAAGNSYKLHSYSDGTGTANINPLSDVIVASAAGDGDASKTYEQSDRDKLRRIGSNLQKTVTILLTKLQPLLQQYNAQYTNPITSEYIANHLDLDEMFDNVKITVNNGILSIINVRTGAVIFSGSITDIANGIFNNNNLPPSPLAPPTPTGLTATGGTGQVTLAWGAVSNATSYNIYYGTASGITVDSWTKISVTTNSYVQTGLNAGTTYYYMVTALNSAGESVASTQVSATTAAAPPVPTVPAAPTGLSATGGTKQVSISWSAVSGATSYNIYYATTSGVSKTNGTKIVGATSPAVQTGLSDSTTYYYIVTAVNSVGESAASVQVAATTLTPVPAPTVPAAPTGVTATGGANQATISWTAVSGATSYNLYRSTSSGVTTSTGTKIAGVTSPYVNTGLSAGTTYYYIVTAMNSVGESVASTQVTATTNAPPPAVPAAPTGVTAIGGANQVSVSWAPVAGATSYNLYWSKTSGVTTATGTKITAVASPYVQTGLTYGTTYYYIVTAVNVSGESPSSAQATATTNPPPVVIPVAPTGVTAVGGANQVTISWPAVVAATSYNIYYSTATGVTTANGTKIAGATSPYVQTGLSAGTAYYYIVTALNSAGESAASAQATATTDAPPPAPACGSCHAIPPATGQHTFHVGIGYTCLTCHGTGYSSTTVNTATHLNGVVNVVNTLNWNGTTCSPGCHGTRTW
jgi:fibronectin type 3 domain-containing protein